MNKSAWLIERVDITPPQYIGFSDDQCDFGFKWTSDHTKAYPYKSKGFAAEAMFMLRKNHAYLFLGGIETAPREHEWIDDF